MLERNNMKTKLLKRIREKAKFKFKDGKWRLLMFGTYYEYSSLDATILKILGFNMMYYDGIFDWNWNGIYNQYVEKLELRKFNK